MPILYTMQAMQLHRSATAPDTMVAAVAANPSWKNQQAVLADGNPLPPKCVQPITALPRPYARAQPTSQQLTQLKPGKSGSTRYELSLWCYRPVTPDRNLYRLFFMALQTSTAQPRLTDCSLWRYRPVRPNHTLQTGFCAQTSQRLLFIVLMNRCRHFKDSLYGGSAHYRVQNTQKIHRGASIPRVGFEAMIPVFELYICCNRDIAVDIANRLRVGRSGIRIPPRAIFFSSLARSDRFQAPPSPLYNGYQCSLSGVELSERDVDYSPPPGAEAKNECSRLASYSVYTATWRGKGQP